MTDYKLFMEFLRNVVVTELSGQMKAILICESIFHSVLFWYLNVFLARSEMIQSKKLIIKANPISVLLYESQHFFPQS